MIELVNPMYSDIRIKLHNCTLK